MNPQEAPGIARVIDDLEGDRTLAQRPNVPADPEGRVVVPPGHPTMQALSVPEVDAKAPTIAAAVELESQGGSVGGDDEALEETPAVGVLTLAEGGEARLPAFFEAAETLGASVRDPAFKAR